MGDYTLPRRSSNGSGTRDSRAIACHDPAWAGTRTVACPRQDPLCCVLAVQEDGRLGARRIKSIACPEGTAWKVTPDNDDCRAGRALRSLVATHLNGGIRWHLEHDALESGNLYTGDSAGSSWERPACPVGRGSLVSQLGAGGSPSARDLLSYR